jgi:alcohol-forming fatty acyl-CoA reductase
MSRRDAYLLTGVTGFLGKVVLSELMRQREALGDPRVFVLIRPTQTSTAAERFESEVATSACFSALHPSWRESVSTISSALESFDSDAQRSDWRVLAEEVTHVIHAAASVRFDLPMATAARANVLAALRLLEFSRTFRRLRKFVFVSTAYTTPHPGPGVRVEQLLPALPASPEDMLHLIARVSDDEALLALTGHPNSYTLTKAVAEHALVDKAASLPLCIVRPSIISASRLHPFPGWIDSMGGLSSVIAAMGSGRMTQLVADPAARLDIVPVDDVAACILDACQAEVHPGASPDIRHAVVGIERATSVQDCIEAIGQFFGRTRAGPRRPVRCIAQAESHGMRWSLNSQDIPMRHALRDRASSRRSGAPDSPQVRRLNEHFQYFTQRSFDFDAPLDLGPGFGSHEYLMTVCRGVHAHMTGGRRRRVRARD